MDIALWIGQIVLAVVFLISGTLKVWWPKQRLIDSGQTGVVFFSQPAIRLIATSELLGAVGVVLPWLTGIASVLTPLAAAGLGVVMIGAATTHVKLREPKNVAITVTLLAMCVFVAIGRFAG
jgi:hypothetical protein